MALRRKAAPATPVTTEEVEATVPPSLRIAGAYSWRILLVVGLAAVVIFLIAQLKDIVVPFMIAILLAALLVPLVNFLVRHRWPRGLAVAVAMVGTIAVVGGLIFVIVSQIRSGYPDLQTRSVKAFDDFKNFLATSPLPMVPRDLPLLAVPSSDHDAEADRPRADAGVRS